MKRALTGVLLLLGCGGEAAPAPVPAAASAAPEVVAAPAEPVLVDAGETDAAEASAPRSSDAFFGEPDAPRLGVLARAEPTQIERGSGGRSLAFRLTFADGSRGYFKPEQTFSGAHFAAEIAAYHLDRMLGLGRVPPTVGRRMDWAPLRAAAGGDARVSEAVVREGAVCGSISYWVPERLVPIRLGLGWESWVRFAPAPSISPFQRARLYAAQASGAVERPEPAETLRAADAPDTADRAAELSDLVLFDYLTENIDRWGGDYTNVRTRGPGGALVFLDNAAGFIDAPQASPGFMDSRLHAVQRFRRSTIEAIRAFSIDAFRARLEADACAVLSERQYAQLEARRATLLAHVDRVIAEHGESALAY
ncbi:MAG: hypothetical protein U0234_23720 [Sandaracinus sp.]